MFLALRAIVIAGAGFAAYRIIFGVEKQRVRSLFTSR